MALTKSTPGEQLIIEGNVRPRVKASAYTTPVVGHLIKNSTAGNDQVARCADGDAPIGLLVSTNLGAVLSVAEFKHNVTVILDYTGTLALGDKVVSKGDSGTVDTTRDRVKQDNSLGVGRVSALDYPTTGQCAVSF